MANPPTSDLKITGVEAIYLRLPEIKNQCDSGQDALIVKVTTDAGITGYGEVDSSPLAVKGCIEGPFSHTATTGLGRVVIGEDPFRTEYLWHKMYRSNIYGGRRGIGVHAISGIDLALWDIKGKALGLPVWKLLGGGFRKSLRAYASSLFGATPAETGQRARRFADQGFTAVKFGWDPMGQDRDTDVALVREARVGLAGNGHDAAVKIGREWSIGLNFGITGFFTFREAREVEKWKAHRAFDFEGTLAGEKHHGSVSIDAIHRMAAMGRPIGEERKDRVLTCVSPLSVGFGRRGHVSGLTFSQIVIARNSKG